MRKPKGPHRDAAAYGLGVLDNSGKFEEHLRGCARCRRIVAEFAPVSAALGRAVRLGYLPPGDRSIPRKRPCLIGSGMRSGTGRLLLVALCLATAVVALSPASRRGWITSAAFIVSPAQVGCGHGTTTGDHPLDLP